MVEISINLMEIKIDLSLLTGNIPNDKSADSQSSWPGGPSIKNNSNKNLIFNNKINRKL